MKYKLIKLLFNKIFKVPYRISSAIEYYYFQIVFFINGAIKKIEKQQNKNFSEIGLDRSLGLKKLSDLTKLYPFIDNSMKSEHQVIFCSLSEIKFFKPKKILEIGTFDGINAFLLSKLFPKSEIITIDLKSEDNDFTDFYGRDSDNKLNNFVKKRNAILENCNNVQFYEKNSLCLIDEDENYDIIWIDGAHGYPILPIDISNSIRLISKGGYIFCDDIYTSNRIKSDNMYKSNAGFETIKVLKKAKIIEFKLFFKRINYVDNSAPKNKKFIAAIKNITN